MAVNRSLTAHSFLHNWEPLLQMKYLAGATSLMEQDRAPAQHSLLSPGKPADPDTDDSFHMAEAMP